MQRSAVLEAEAVQVQHIAKEKAVHAQIGTLTGQVAAQKRDLQAAAEAIQVRTHQALLAWLNVTVFSISLFTIVSL